MEELGPPPAELPRPRANELRVLDQHHLLWRIYRAGARHPQTWSGFRLHGPVASSRFDPHRPPPRRQPGRGICYAAVDLDDTGDGLAAAATVFAEAFQPDAPSGPSQPAGAIDLATADPWLVLLRVQTPLTLLDVSSH